MPGKLIVVATPIGNLEDLTPRAARALSEADLIACEDTRRTGRLLAHLGTKRPLLSLHEHNERQRVPRLVKTLQRGDSVALVSDAGTPLLSDPGFVLIRECLERGIEVLHLPGPSALVTALVQSGLPPHPFTFAGFPPPKSGKRRRFFERFAGLGHTLVLFESPHRILASLDDLAAVLGDRPAALGRELTKLHEETLRGSLSDIRRQLGRRTAIKGELTLVVGAAAATPPSTSR
jgi:16S rRNA (cytidine1402-2'-O)-methyltransferase